MFSQRRLLLSNRTDFGDLDLLILLDGKIKQAVLLEAKVKTSQTNDWSIASQWAAFCDLPKAVAKTSNLFMQLYRKMRLIRRIRCSDDLDYSERMRKTNLGQNTVVKEAAKLLGEYCREAWFVSLIPGSKPNTERFFESELPKPFVNLPDWDHTKMGFLNWEELEHHCNSQRTDWPNTLASFAYNTGQIYGMAQSTEKQLIPPLGSFVTWNATTGQQTGVVKRRGRLNSRVIRSDGESEKVPNDELKW